MWLFATAMLVEGVVLLREKSRGWLASARGDCTQVESSFSLGSRDSNLLGMDNPSKERIHRDAMTQSDITEA